MTNLGRVLHLFRTRTGLSQRAMAKQIGIGHTTLFYAEQRPLSDVIAWVRLIAWFNRPAPRSKKTLGSVAPKR